MFIQSQIFRFLLEKKKTKVAATLSNYLTNNHDSRSVVGSEVGREVFH